MPAAEIAQFEANLTFARDTLGSANALAKLVTSAIDLSDLYRAALVQGVSAFDYFIHDEVRVRILELFDTPTDWPAALSKFRVSLGSVQEALEAERGGALHSDWLERQIREQHQVLSFQQPEKVADAIRLVSEVRLWELVADQMVVVGVGKLRPDQVLRNQLKLIVDRRNLIVHEADLDPTPPRSRRYKMNEVVASEALDFLDGLAHGIAAVLAD